MLNRNYYTITIALLGALKLILDSFGIKLITNQNTNDIANAIATFLTVAGVFMSHIKNSPKLSFKAFVSSLFKKKSNASAPAPAANVTQSVQQVTKTVQTTSAAPATNTVASSPAQVEQPKEEPTAPVAKTTNSEEPTTTDNMVQK